MPGTASGANSPTISTNRPDASKATVYRHIDLLVGGGILEVGQPAESRARRNTCSVLSISRWKPLKGEAPEQETDT